MNTIMWKVLYKVLWKYQKRPAMENIVYKNSYVWKGGIRPTQKEY